MSDNTLSQCFSTHGSHVDPYWLPKHKSQLYFSTIWVAKLCFIQLWVASYKMLRATVLNNKLRTDQQKIYKVKFLCQACEPAKTYQKNEPDKTQRQRHRLGHFLKFRFLSSILKQFCSTFICVFHVKLLYSDA